MRPLHSSGASSAARQYTGPPSREGEAQAARNAYANLNTANKIKVIAFLESLVLFPPDDTASNLNPGDPTHPDFPQRGHGSIALTVLFNDPTDVE